MEPIIRKETPHDYRAVETMTRNAFYNIYVPGCIEHYLVHTMRSHEDFYSRAGFCAGAGRAGDRQYYVHQSRTVGRTRRAEGNPYIRSALHRPGIPAQRLWQTADGIFLCTGRLHGIRRHCDFRGSRQLHQQRLPEL